MRHTIVNSIPTIPAGTEFEILTEVKPYSYATCKGLPVNSVYFDEYEVLKPMVEFRTVVEDETKDTSYSVRGMVSQDSPESVIDLHRVTVDVAYHNPETGEVVFEAPSSLNDIPSELFDYVMSDARDTFEKIVD